jgi:LCP family protein required for cell wall assembly
MGDFHTPLRRLFSLLLLGLLFVLLGCGGEAALPTLVPTSAGLAVLQGDAIVDGPATETATATAPAMATVEHRRRRRARRRVPAPHPAVPYGRHAPPRQRRRRRKPRRLCRSRSRRWRSRIVPPFFEGVPTPGTAVPTPVPTFEVPDNTTNILLLGSDTTLDAEESRTDTMIIVSVNLDRKTASLISLPRDLYVYQPGRTMNRLNTAMTLGGIDLLKQTILYNFGIPVHYYARVDFAGFQQGIDAIGGIDVNVSCRLNDWRLISPELDPEDEDNWERFELPAGVHHMDGDLALWYARSRLSSSDFDRGRRQQQLLRAMLNQGVDLGLVGDIPALWSTYQDTVDTDLDIGRLLQLAAVAPAVRENGVQHLYLARTLQSWTTPNGAAVQLPVWEGEGMMAETFSRLYRTPTLNRAGRPPIYVEIVNQTGNPDMALLAADNLAWYGFIPVIAAEDPQEGSRTELLYYRPNFKDSYDWLISWIFSMRKGEIQLAEEEGWPSITASFWARIMIRASICCTSRKNSSIERWFPLFSPYRFRPWLRIPVSPIFCGILCPGGIIRAEEFIYQMSD